MVTVAQVSKFVGEVTSEQIGRCHASVDANGVTYYMVENERGDMDESGEMVEYKVEYSKAHGFTCGCKAGQVGFIRCARGFCKHVLWALTCALEVKTAVAAMEREAAIEKLAAAHSPMCEQYPCIEEGTSFYSGAAQDIGFYCAKHMPVEVTA